MFSLVSVLTGSVSVSSELSSSTGSVLVFMVFWSFSALSLFLFNGLHKDLAVTRLV